MIKDYCSNKDQEVEKLKKNKMDAKLKIDNQKVEIESLKQNLSFMNKKIEVQESIGLTLTSQLSSMKEHLDPLSKKLKEIRQKYCLDSSNLSNDFEVVECIDEQLYEYKKLEIKLNRIIGKKEEELNGVKNELGKVSKENIQNKETVYNQHIRLKHLDDIRRGFKEC